jgi:TolB-like protein
MSSIRKELIMKWKLSLPCLLLVLVLLLPSPSVTQTKDPNKIYKVAVLPFLIHSQENLDYLREGIYDILSSRITDERIVVIDRSLVERALYEERPMRLDDAVATKIGMRVGADFIVLGSLTKVGSYISLDARLISLTEEKPPLGAYTQHKGIDDVMTKIGDFAQDIGMKILGRRAMAGRSADPKHPYLVRPRKDPGRIDPEGVKFKKSQTFNFEVKGIDIGDVDGDKKNELVVIDHHSVYIFKYDGEKLNLFQHIEAGYYHNFLTVDVADVNRNGYAEIIVTSVVEDDLRSFILEFEQGKFRKITEKAGWYFRVLEDPKEGPLLMGQKMGSEGVFVGPVYRFIWKKKEFDRGPVMPFPKDTMLFGLTLADIKGDGKQGLVLYDYSERLLLHSPDGKPLWASTSKYGGTANFYETKRKKDLAFRPHEAPPWRVYIPGRILVKDLDGDGMYEIIVNKNEFASGTLFDRVRIPEKGEIHGLTWDGDGLSTEWKTREIRGYIADFQVKDVENDGEEELVVGVVNPSDLTDRKTTSTILFFKLD